MESEASVADVLARLEPELEGIEGLITVRARDDRLIALTTSRSVISGVRQELLELGVSDEMLEVEVLDEVRIPYPVTDERLRRWLQEAEEGGAAEAAVTVRAPAVGMTPRGVAKVVFFLAIGLWLLSGLFFSLLMLVDWWRAR